jgi:hypothetical protein
VVVIIFIVLLMIRELGACKRKEVKKPGPQQL